MQGKLELFPRRVIQKWNESFANDEEVRRMADAAFMSGLRTSLIDHRVLQEDPREFNIRCTPELKALDQEYTGLCWLFSGLNLLRRRLVKMYRIDADDFALSQTYLLFYHKLENAYAFLQYMHTLRDEPFDHRVKHHLRANFITDGANWSTFVSLVMRYGIVPASLMQPSRVARDTEHLNAFLKTLLFEAADRLSRPGVDANAEIRETMRRVHRILCVALGIPPDASKPLEWTYKTKHADGDSDSEPSRVVTSRVSPLALFASANDALDIETFVVCTHLPGRATGKYRVRFMDTVLDGMPNCFYNVSHVDILSRATLHCMRRNIPVWFGCEFDFMRLRCRGLLHHELVRKERLLEGHEETDAVTDRTERLRNGNVAINHAMLFVGAHADDDVAVRWSVENSHGDEDARDGFLLMTAGWFDRHTYVVAVPPDALPPATLQEDEHILEPWDILANVLGDTNDPESN